MRGELGLGCTTIIMTRDDEERQRFAPKDYE